MVRAMRPPTEVGVVVQEVAVRQAEASEVDDLINRLAIWLDVPRQRVATAVHQVLDGHELEAARHHGVAVRGDTRQQRLAGLRAILEVEAGP